jgi:heptaprenyl diphosphate synthase
MTKTKKLVFLSVLVSLAFILSYVEMLLPPIYSAIPGIKIGLANIIIIFLLYKFSFKSALLVSLLRVILVSALFGNAVMFVYSLSGAVLSLCLMVILKKTNRFSSISVSVIGGVAHNLGQIIVAIILMQTPQIAFYMAVLAISGTLSGVAVGIISAYVLKYTKKLKF